MDLLKFLKVPTVMIDGLSVNALAGIVLVILLVLGFLALRGRGLWAKVLALALSITAIAPLGIALAEQLSYPKEFQLVWLQAQGDDGVLIHGTIDEAPDRIQLWMDISGEPRAFYIPWTKALEQSLNDAEKRLQGAGGKGDLHLKFQPSLKADPQFFGTLWPAPPDKDGEPDQDQPPPRVFVPSQVSA